MKINFRDRLPVLLFMSGVFLLLIVSTNLVSLFTKLYQTSMGLKSSTGYTWESYFAFYLYDNESEQEEYYEKRIKEYFEELQNCEFTTGIRNFILPIGIDGNSEYVTILFSAKENPKDVFEEGSFPENDSQSAGVVYIGEAIKPFCEERAGELYLRLYHEELRVAGVLKSTSLEENRQIYLYYSKLGDSTKAQICEAYLESTTIRPGMESESDAILFVGSNIQDVSEIAGILITDMEKYDLKNGQPIKYKDTIMTQSDQYLNGKLRLVFFSVVGVFAIGNLVQITYLWMARKKKNIIICRAFGMKEKHIVKSLLIEALGMVGISYVLCFLVELIIYSVGKSVEITGVLKYSFGALGVVVILVVFTVSVLYLTFRKGSVVEALNKE